MFAYEEIVCVSASIDLPYLTLADVLVFRGKSTRGVGEFECMYVSGHFYSTFSMPH